MLQNDKIPIVVGVAGHRNIDERDKQALKDHISKNLTDIRNLCKSKGKDKEDTPVIMLNAFAQGADMLCADVAFALGIRVYAVLPCEIEKYKQSFDVNRKTAEKEKTSAQDIAKAAQKDDEDKKKLDDYLSKVRLHGGQILYAPDIEKNKAWIKRTINIDDDSYQYRQTGIYIAEHSHILIALWDGNPSEEKYGCGTAEVIKFALEHKFLDKDKLFKPGMINDSAVLWIKSRRQGDKTEEDIRDKWLISGLAGDEGERHGDYLVYEKSPAFLEKIISKTVAYNAKKIDMPQGKIRLWGDVDELDEYRKNLRQHYIKADGLSYEKNQKKYILFIKLLAVIGTVLTFMFLIYDDASLPHAIFPCTVAIALILWLPQYGKRKGYHRNYIEYRAFAEALRIQFYMSMCLTESPAETNVCDLYTWSQKVDMVWIDKAIRALCVISEAKELKIDSTGVIEAWIGNNEDPKGQLRYHIDKKDKNKKQAKKYSRLSKIFKTITVVIYLLIFVLEVVALALKVCDVSWFWEGKIFARLSWRNMAAILLGTATAGSLLASSYWGKMSYDRKLDDNEKMSKFYASAFERWNEVKNHKGEIERFVKEIAREEIVENGIWCSYVNDNDLEINI